MRHTRQDCQSYPSAFLNILRRVRSAYSIKMSSHVLATATVPRFTLVTRVSIVPNKHIPVAMLQEIITQRPPVDWINVYEKDMLSLYRQCETYSMLCIFSAYIFDHVRRPNRAFISSRHTSTHHTRNLRPKMCVLIHFGSSFRSLVPWIIEIG